LNEPDRLNHLRLFAELDLSLDVNGGVDSLPSVAALARAVPELRIIIDHVVNVRIDGETPPLAWLDGMGLAAERRNVFCKVSGLVEGSGRRNGQAPRNLNFYRPVLDHVWRLFAPDRVIYGSNWPVSELFTDFATVHSLVKSYCAEKERDCGRFFADNARVAYKWVQR
jgi:L-fuconolactonase